MRHVHHDWLEAGERTQSTVRQLSEQLRRFLDDRVWLENRRVIDLLRRIELTALAVRDHAPKGPFSELDATAPQVALPFERPLYSPPARMTVDSGDVSEGGDDVDSSLLYEQVFVDRARLCATVRRALQGRDQVDLREVVEAAPLEEGLAEVVAYLALDDAAFDVVFDDAVRSRVTWAERDGVRRAVTLPAVTFVRAARGARQQEAAR
jgi:hypothetical protein